MSEPGSCCQTPPKKETPGLSAYTPLFVILALSILVALALQVPLAQWSAHLWMHHFMGIFLVLFAMVKLFDLPGFATSFAKYDLLAGAVHPYALAYPFIELSLGLGYLALWQPRLIYLATIIILSLGTLGVLNSIRKREALDCACMGSFLKVPVSTVTLTENLSMIAMALIMFLTAKG